MSEHQVTELMRRLLKQTEILNIEVIQDRYFNYDNEIYHTFHTLKEKINNKQDLIKLKEEIQDLGKRNHNFSFQSNR